MGKILYYTFKLIFFVLFFLNRTLSNHIFYLDPIINRMSKVVLLALLLSLSLCLHVDHQHQSSQHLEPVESLNDTIETLEAIQSNLSSSIDGSFLGDGELVQFLENVIKSNVDDLYNFEVETIPVVALNPHICSNLSQENKQRLV